MWLFGSLFKPNMVFIRLIGLSLSPVLAHLNSRASGPRSRQLADVLAPVVAGLV